MAPPARVVPDRARVGFPPCSTPSPWRCSSSPWRSWSSRAGMPPGPACSTTAAARRGRSARGRPPRAARRGPGPPRTGAGRRAPSGRRSRHTRSRCPSCHPLPSFLALEGEDPLVHGGRGGRGLRGRGDDRTPATDLEHPWLTPDRTPRPSPRPTPRPTRSGPGVVLVALYGLLALAATGRSILQIVEYFSTRPARVPAVCPCRRHLPRGHRCLGARWPHLTARGARRHLGGAGRRAQRRARVVPGARAPSPTRRCGRTSAPATASYRWCCPSSACSGCVGWRGPPPKGVQGEGPQTASRTKTGMSRSVLVWYCA